MSFVVRPEVDRWGYWTGGDAHLPTSTAVWRWTEPYPAVGTVLELAWEPGEAGVPPDLGIHNRLRDLVCSERAATVLQRLAPTDVHVVARAVGGGAPLTIVQATSVLDVLDPGRSTFRDGQPDVVAFPGIAADREEQVARRLFRLPDRGMSLTVLVGDELRRALLEADLDGVEFVPTQEATA